MRFGASTSRAGFAQAMAPVANDFMHALTLIRNDGRSEAITILEPYGPSVDLARSLSDRSMLEFLYVDADEAVLPILDQAMSVASEIGDDESMADALNVKAQLIYSRGDLGGMAVRDARGVARRIAGSLTDLTNRRAVAVSVDPGALYAILRSDGGVNTLIAMGAIAGGRPLPALRVPHSVRPLLASPEKENRR